MLSPVFKDLPHTFHVHCSSTSWTLFLQCISVVIMLLIWVLTDDIIEICFLSCVLSPPTPELALAFDQITSAPCIHKGFLWFFLALSIDILLNDYSFWQILQQFWLPEFSICFFIYNETLCFFAVVCFTWSVICWVINIYIVLSVLISKCCFYLLGLDWSWNNACQQLVSQIYAAF